MRTSPRKHPGAARPGKRPHRPTGLVPATTLALAWGTILVLALGACGAPNPPGGGSAIGVSISYPLPDQTLAGTVAVAAAGHGGPASDLRFSLGGAAVDARADGTATIDTRGLAD